MGAFKLGKMTFGSLFKKPETVLYPFEKKPQPMGLKGHVEITAEDCILCGMCDRSCTTGCITVDKQARTWAIDRLQCVQCGYCITVCPKKCLAMNPDYAAATTVHERTVFSIPQQAGKPAAKQTTQVKAAEKPAGKPAEKPALPERDDQLETLIALMDAEKAEKVRAVL